MTAEGSPADRLHDLARRVLRLAAAGRTDPESVLIEKQEIALAIRAVARELPTRTCENAQVSIRVRRRTLRVFAPLD